MVVFQICRLQPIPCVCVCVLETVIGHFPNEVKCSHPKGQTKTPPPIEFSWV